MSPLSSTPPAADMPIGWRKIDRGLFESADGEWRICNPWKLNTELRHRWLVAQRQASGSGWCMHDANHATLHEARAYVESRDDFAARLDLPCPSTRTRHHRRST